MDNRPSTQLTAKATNKRGSANNSRLSHYKDGAAVCHMQALQPSTFMTREEIDGVHEIYNEIQLEPGYTTLGAILTTVPAMPNSDLVSSQNGPRRSSIDVTVPQTA